uniref:Uncharacterized protein n=1 Tax=Oryza barthii TaxID=65489 RepID=A0A0D3FE32_9ORYZ
MGGSSGPAQKRSIRGKLPAAGGFYGGAAAVVPGAGPTRRRSKRGFGWGNAERRLQREQQRFANPFIAAPLATHLEINLASHFIFKSFILAAAIQTQDFWSVVHAITGLVFAFKLERGTGSLWFQKLHGPLETDGEHPTLAWLYVLRGTLLYLLPEWPMGVKDQRNNNSRSYTLHGIPCVE